LFDEVLIPKGVQKELFAKESEFFSSLKILRVDKPKNANLVKALRLIVDEGEAEAIALSMELKLPLLIDDLKGRKLAEKLGLRFIGSLGLLKVAKKKGIIKEVKPFVQKFVEEGYYLDEKLIRRFLESVGEKW